MVPVENLWAFVAASVVLIVIPGPSVLFVIGRSLALGRLGGVLSVGGNAHGMVPLVAAVALGVVFIVLALICDSVWALAASAARNWFARSPKRAAHLAATGGVMMIGLGGVLAFTGNKH